MIPVLCADPSGSVGIHGTVPAIFHRASRTRGQKHAPRLQRGADPTIETYHGSGTDCARYGLPLSLVEHRTHNPYRTHRIDIDRMR